MASIVLYLSQTYLFAFIGNLDDSLVEVKDYFLFEITFAPTPPPIVEKSNVFKYKRRGFIIFLLERNCKAAKNNEFGLLYSKFRSIFFYNFL